MSEFKPFDTEGFLYASKHWAEKIEKLEAELENLSPLPSVNNESGVRSSTPSDMTAQMALRRLQIASRIEELRLHEENLKYGLKHLSEEEIELLNGFFFPRKAIGAFVWEYGRRYGMSERKVYMERTRVLKKLGSVLDPLY